MIKTKELTDPNACMVRAKPEEMTFVLLARDVAAPATIRYWARERFRLKKNDLNDPQIVEAFACASFMDQQRDKVKSLPEAAQAPAAAVSEARKDVAKERDAWRRLALAHTFSEVVEQDGSRDLNRTKTFPVCSCGWRGFGIASYNDDLYHRLRFQKQDHARDVRSANGVTNGK